MSATPYANGGVLLRDLKLPKYGDHAVPVAERGRAGQRQSRSVPGPRRSARTRRRPAFGPDETASNRLQDVYEVTDKVWRYRIEDVDEHLAHADG